jgi:hypothetical protein
MKTSIQAATAAITLLATPALHAQEAVQWRVQDGGNGHWYEGRRLSTTSPVSWGSARITALSSGGDLVSLNTPQESAWVFANIASTPSLWSLSCGPWIGAAQLPGSHEPSAGWTWVDSTSLDPSFPWTPAHQPDNATYCGGSEDYACYWYGEGTPQPANRFADLVESGYCIVRPKGDWVTSAVIEWSADCNADGIVDYGQCREGTLPDYDGDNIPDCCESGSPCLVGNYPVQWRAEDGGNGHWYQWRGWGVEPTFDGATDQAMQLGGHLATVVSDAEAAAVLSIVSDDSCEPQYGGAIWLGARQQPGQTSPGSGWSWVTAEPWSYVRWRSGEPNDFQGVQEDRLVFSKVGGYWLDVPDHPVFSPPCVFGLLVEWSADCNSDGIVDYGQILQGRLADANADGVPDTCQVPTCADADIYRDFNVNGADLGILLSQWGPNTPLTESDLNGDGVVNGADLGLLLSFWGACP